jgi:undecaprenyl-diphosphatase
VKLAFDRPRPQVFTWGTHAATTSFPSGHAMSAAAVYGTIAFLAARLAHRRAVRIGVHGAAAVLVLAICFSRIYLGVHYPSDVVAGALLGAAWAAFCAAVLEAAAWAARRRGGRRPGGRSGDADAAPAMAAHGDADASASRA